MRRAVISVSCIFAFPLAAQQQPDSTQSKADAPYRTFVTTWLKTPESVVHDEELDVYFVSNMDGKPQEKDGRGFIARVGPDGKVQDLHFIAGLNAPKGLAIRGDELWVTDIDRVLAVSKRSGHVLAIVDLASQQAVFLNDVTVGGDSAIYVTDTGMRLTASGGRERTGTDRIFRISDQEVSVVYKGPELDAPNGIVWDGSQFVIAPNLGQDLLSWSNGGRPERLARGPGAFDGIVVLQEGVYLVTSRKDMGVHLVTRDMTRVLFSRPPTPADIGYDRKRRVLLIPSLEGNTLEGWKIPPFRAGATTVGSQQ